MHRMILAIFTFLFYLSWAEVKVEKVLETTSIKEYNQWVKKNKAKYPGLNRYYFKVEGIKHGKKYKIYYYNEDGDLAKVELVSAKPGRWLYVHAYSDWGKIMIVETDSSLGESSPILHTIKNEKGEEIFSFKWGFDYVTYAGVRALPGGIGLIRSRPYEDKPMECYAELFTWDGKKIGELKNICGFSINSVASADKKFILLSDEDRGTAIFIANGSECWRKSFSGYWSISNKGEYVSVGVNIASEGVVHVYDIEGNLLYSYKFLQKNKSGTPIPLFSSNNKYLLATFNGEYVLINNITGQKIWQKKCEGNILSFSKSDKYFITVNKETQKIFIYDTLGNLTWVLGLDYGEDIRKKRTKEGEIIESKVLYYKWASEVFDDLIITNSGREWHPIIFQIIE